MCAGYLFRVMRHTVKSELVPPTRGGSFKMGGTVSNCREKRQTPTARKGKSMQNEIGMPILVVCYRENQYDAVRAFALDKIFFERTFQSWKMLVEDTVQRLIEEGESVCFVDFDHKAFVDWAVARNVQSTQQSRIAYCAELLSKARH